MRKILRSLGIAILGVALTTGVVSAATGTIDGTGPDSDNNISVDNHDDESVTNANAFTATNNNPQTADSGDAETHDNNEGGGATSGGASNDGTLDVSLTIDNSPSGTAWLNGDGDGNSHDASILNTGPNSTNNVTFDSNRTLTVTNSNAFTVTNNNTQTATTGDAFVHHNTTGGDATSGDASNTSSATITIGVTN